MLLITFLLHETFQQMRHYLKKKYVGNTARWRQAGMEALQWKTVARRHTFFKFSFSCCCAWCLKSCWQDTLQLVAIFAATPNWSPLLFFAAFPPFICNSTLFCAHNNSFLSSFLFYFFFLIRCLIFLFWKPCVLRRCLFFLDKWLLQGCVCVQRREWKNATVSLAYYVLNTNKVKILSFISLQYKINTRGQSNRLQLYHLAEMKLFVFSLICVIWTGGPRFVQCLSTFYHRPRVLLLNSKRTRHKKSSIYNYSVCPGSPFLSSEDRVLGGVIVLRCGRCAEGPPPSESIQGILGKDATSESPPLDRQHL